MSDLQKTVQLYKANRKKVFAVIRAVVFSVAVIYHLFFAVFYAVGVSSGKYGEKQLTLADFEHVAVEPTGENGIETVTDDSQLIYNRPVRNIYIRFDFSRDPGEIVSYYNSKGDNSWSRSKVAYGRKYDDGVIFYYPPGTGQARIDLGIFSSVKIQVKEIVADKPVARTIAGISGTTVFITAVAPMIIFTLLDTIAEGCIFLVEKKRK